MGDNSPRIKCDQYLIRRMDDFFDNSFDFVTVDYIPSLLNTLLMNVDKCKATCEFKFNFANLTRRSNVIPTTNPISHRHPPLIWSSLSKNEFSLDGMETFLLFNIKGRITSLTFSKLLFALSLLYIDTCLGFGSAMVM